MPNHQTHADDTQAISIICNSQNIINKLIPANEMAFGTVYVEYLYQGFFAKLFPKSHKPKNASEIKFVFDGENNSYTKNDIIQSTNFTFELGGTSVCPLFIKKTNIGKTFIQTISNIRKDYATQIPDIRMFKTCPIQKNPISSPYNCVYNMHDFDYVGHLRYVLGIICVSDDTNLTEFTFAYNKNLLNTNEVVYLLNGILCNGFY